MITVGKTISLAPILIQPLLEIYCLNLEEDMPHWSALANNFRDLLFAEGEMLLKHKDPPPEDERYCLFELTERGHVYIEALIDTRLPEQQWVVPEKRQEK